MTNLTFLTNEQCHELEVLKKRGLKAKMTDFSKLLSGFDHPTLVDDQREYWTKTADQIDVNGKYTDKVWLFGNQIASTTKGARPVLQLSSSDIQINGRKRASDGILEVEYGYYPQQAVSKEMQQSLESAYRAGIVSKTGNEYTTDTARGYDENDRGFAPWSHAEFQLDGKRYVRLIVKNISDRTPVRLSNGETYIGDHPVWIEVAPVKWLVDEKTGIMLTDRLIFSGVKFNDRNDDYDFERSNIKAFMDTYLSKELEQSREIGKAYEPSQRMTETTTTETLIGDSADSRYFVPEYYEDLTLEELEKIERDLLEEYERKMQVLAYEERRTNLFSEIKEVTGKIKDAETKIKTNTIQKPNK